MLPVRARRHATTPTSSPTTRTTRVAIPKCVVIDHALRLGGRRAARTRRWHETVIYETHVKGFTKRHPGVREDLRGTYAGPGVRRRRSSYLKRARRHRGRAAAGPPHRRRVASSHERGLTNYWGYSSIGYLAPHARLRRDRHRAASRCASSRAWSRRCTAPASR